MDHSAIPNAETPFADLMALEKVLGKDHTYMSKTPAWAPGGSWNSFGGHVYAQALWAAAQEVPEGLVAHSTHGYFTLPGKIDRPYVFTITHFGDTRYTCQRSVFVRQPRRRSRRDEEEQFAITDADGEMGDVCFHMICSFKIATPTLSAHQEPNWGQQYTASLGGKRPEDWDICPDIDMPWYEAHIRKFPEHKTFPGLEIRKADCEPYNKGKPPGDYRQLHYYRRVGEMSRAQPNLHAAAHLYASDRNGLFLIARAMGFGDRLAKIASLGHSVIFHTDADEMLLEGDGWWTQEAWTTRSAGGRGSHESKLWSPSGVHVATTLQDGLVKKAEPGTLAMFEGFGEAFASGDAEDGETEMSADRAQVKETAKL